MENNKDSIPPPKLENSSSTVSSSTQPGAPPAAPTEPLKPSPPQHAVTVTNVSPAEGVQMNSAAGTTTAAAAAAEVKQQPATSTESTTTTTSSASTPIKKPTSRFRIVSTTPASISSTSINSQATTTTTAPGGGGGSNAVATLPPAADVVDLQHKQQAASNKNDSARPPRPPPNAKLKQDAGAAAPQPQQQLLPQQHLPSQQPQPQQPQPVATQQQQTQQYIPQQQQQTQQQILQQQQTQQHPPQHQTQHIQQSLESAPQIQVAPAGPTIVGMVGTTPIVRMAPGTTIVKKKKGRFNVLQEVPIIQTTEGIPSIVGTTAAPTLMATPLTVETYAAVPSTVVPTTATVPTTAVPATSAASTTVTNNVPSRSGAASAPPPTASGSYHPVAPTSIGTATALPVVNNTSFSQNTSGVTEYQSTHHNGSQASPQNGNLPAQNQVSVQTRAPVVKKKGRFVITSVTDPSLLAQSTQTQMMPIRLTAAPTMFATINHPSADHGQNGAGSPSLTYTQLVPQQVVYAAAPAQQQPLSPSRTSAPAPHVPNDLNKDNTTTPALEPRQEPKQTTQQQQQQSSDGQEKAPTKQPLNQPPRSRPNLASQKGLGKVFYFLDQMRAEVVETDRTMKELQSEIKRLQTDMKFLKEKNKELEAKARDAERKLCDEKSRHETTRGKLISLREWVREKKKEGVISVMNTGSDEEGRKRSDSNTDSDPGAPVRDAPSGEMAPSSHHKEGSEKGSEHGKDYISKTTTTENGSKIRPPEHTAPTTTVEIVSSKTKSSSGGEASLADHSAKVVLEKSQETDGPSASGSDTDHTNKPATPGNGDIEQPNKLESDSRPNVAQQKITPTNGMQKSQPRVAAAVPNGNGPKMVARSRSESVSERTRNGPQGFPNPSTSSLGSKSLLHNDPANQSSSSAAASSLASKFVPTYDAATSIGTSSMTNYEKENPSTISVGAMSKASFEPGNPSTTSVGSMSMGNRSMYDLGNHTSSTSWIQTVGSQVSLASQKTHPSEFDPLMRPPESSVTSQHADGTQSLQVSSLPVSSIGYTDTGQMFQQAQVPVLMMEQQGMAYPIVGVANVEDMGIQTQNPFVQFPSHQALLSTNSVGSQQQQGQTPEGYRQDFAQGMFFVQQTDMPEGQVMAFQQTDMPQGQMMAFEQTEMSPEQLMAFQQTGFPQSQMMTFQQAEVPQSHMMAFQQTKLSQDQMMAFQQAGIPPSQMMTFQQPIFQWQEMNPQQSHQNGQIPFAGRVQQQQAPQNQQQQVARQSSWQGQQQRTPPNEHQQQTWQQRPPTNEQQQTWQQRPPQNEQQQQQTWQGNQQISLHPSQSSQQQQSLPQAWHGHPQATPSQPGPQAAWHHLPHQQQNGVTGQSWPGQQPQIPVPQQPPLRKSVTADFDPLLKAPSTEEPITDNRPVHDVHVVPSVPPPSSSSMDPFGL